LVIVVVDYFTKWIEAESVTKIMSQQIQNFVWKIIYRLGLPYAIITDNGRQLIDKRLKEFYDNLGVKHLTSFVEHTQTNG